MGSWEIRDYDSTDEDSWLRCRVLSFLYTCYYDDVLVAKPKYEPSVELVAVDNGVVVGILDAAVRDRLATIETIAVHPDHQGQGIASGLLRAVLPRLRALGATELDAWTREATAALGWYTATGFVEVEHYTHVHASGSNEIGAALKAAPGFSAASAFLHAPSENESRLRERFSRVYRCRRFLQPL